MSQPVAKPMTLEAFFSWQEGQNERYEFIDGFPLRLMAGATNAHDRIVVNLISELRNQLRGTDCRPFTGDGSVRTRQNRIRRPDAGVDCGKFLPDGLTADAPRLVAEVLSPSTRDYDTFEKLAEYEALDTLDYILFVEPNAPEAALWRRDADRSWTRDTIKGLDSHIAMPAIDIDLALADLYDGIEFPPSPQLVVG